MCRGPTRIVEACLDTACAIHWPDRVRQREASGDRPASPAARTAMSAAEKKRRAIEDAWKKARVGARIALAKGVIAKPVLTAKLVLDILSPYAAKEVETRTKVKLTDATAAAVLLLHALGHHERTRADFAAFGKLVGFDLAKYEREAARGKATKPPKAKKAKRKA
jgi:uncharacterized membrane protein